MMTFRRLRPSMRYVGYKPNKSKYDPAAGSHIPGGKRRAIEREIGAEYEQEMTEQSEGT